jgi:hypothetical protein
MDVEILVLYRGNLKRIYDGLFFDEVGDLFMKKEGFFYDSFLPG